MKFLQFFKEYLIWISLGLLSLLIRWILGFFPYIAEYIYSRGLFMWIRRVFDYTIGLLPFPSVYILAFLLVLSLWRGFWALFRFRNRELTILGHFVGFLLKIAAWGGGIIFFFMLLWGFNYARPPLEKQLQIKLEKLDTSEIVKEVFFSAQKATEWRSKIMAADTFSLDDSYFQGNIEQQAREALSKTLKKLGFPVAGRVRGRLLDPAGLLLRTRISGIYIPFIGEGHIDAGLHILQQPFTMAHEMAHGLGFTDEGDCNFLAYLACQTSDDMAIKYSGELTYLRYVLGEWRANDSTAYKQARRNLPKGIIADLDAINKNYSLYKNWISAEFQDNMYNQFLQSQGVAGGIDSYDKIIPLVVAWNKKKDKN